VSIGLDQMLDENRIEDLTLFYQLLSRVHHGLKELCTSFAAYIKVSSSSSSSSSSRAGGGGVMFKNTGFVICPRVLFACVYGGIFCSGCSVI